MEEGKLNSDGEERISKMDKEFDADAKQQELIERFASMDPKEAQRQIAILPYYHQLENEIIKPNQGIYVTRYFLAKWKPCLGPEATNIVLALRFLANKDGETFASQETIAEHAGLSLRAVQRWLSDNHAIPLR